MLIFAPSISLVLAFILIITYLPNLELLSFRTVFALPKPSKIGLQFKIFVSNGISSFFDLNLLKKYVMHRIAFLVVSVFPAPDSPLIIND